MKQEITFEYARDIIRQKLQNTYGNQLQEIDNAQPIEPLTDRLVMDAFVGSECKFRFTIYFNMHKLQDEEPDSIYESVLHQTSINPNHTIIICHMTDEEEIDWIDQDWLNIEKAEGLWLVPGYGINEETFNEMTTTIFRILSGQRFKVGFRVGVNKGLTLLMVQDRCPECGEILWVPDSILLPVIPTDNMTRKVWLLSFESIFCYEHQIIAQIAEIYNSLETKLGIMQMNPEYGFRMKCHKCGTQLHDYDKAHCDYCEHEMGNEWFRWIEQENLDDTVKFLPIDQVSISTEDVCKLAGIVCCADNFLFMGIYDLEELVRKPLVECNDNELMHNVLAVHRHMLSFPPFRMDMGTSYAEVDNQFVFTVLSSYLDHASQLIKSHFNEKE